jgi:protein disulfide-isomerase
MKTRLGLLAVALAALTFAPVQTTFAAEWMTSYDAAVKASKRTGKPILADFTGSDWCGWCIRLRKEVFDTKEFQAWAKKSVILLELDYPQSKPQPAAVKQQNAKLARDFQIQGYPTILFLNASGKVLGEYGYDRGGPANWTKKATQIIKTKPGRMG